MSEASDEFNTAGEMIPYWQRPGMDPSVDGHRSGSAPLTQLILDEQDGVGGCLAVSMRATGFRTTVAMDWQLLCEGCVSWCRFVLGRIYPTCCW